MLRLGAVEELFIIVAVGSLLLERTLYRPLYKSTPLDQVLVETGLGRSRIEAIKAMGQRTGASDLQNFANAVVQSQQLGTGISTILKVQADEIRRRRYLR